MTIKVLTVFGTRPEVIKLAPLIKVLESTKDVISITCASTQQRDLQNGILSLFGIEPNYDLDLMKSGQDLFHITETVLSKIKEVLEIERPDYVVVQGDTTTAFAASLAAFYKKIPIVHIEAGLRTGKLYSPYPEEANRCLISRIATLHMAPTQLAKDNLAREGIIDNVFCVGNTIVDAVYWAVNNLHPTNVKVGELLKGNKTKILITAHRRENFGQPIVNICEAIASLCNKYNEIQFIWPLHPNPNIKNIVESKLANLNNLEIIEPLNYGDLLLVIKNCSLILSDSGGIQEESCILGKNIIILRDDTERPEVVSSGYGVLVGANTEKICQQFERLIITTSKKSSNIYGLPGVSKEIVERIKTHYQDHQ